VSQTNYNKGQFPQKLQPGKPLLKQQQNNNVVEATRQERVQENNTTSLLNIFATAGPFRVGVYFKLFTELRTNYAKF